MQALVMLIKVQTGFYFNPLLLGGWHGAYTPNYASFIRGNV